MIVLLSTLYSTAYLVNMQMQLGNIHVTKLVDQA